MTTAAPVDYAPIIRAELCAVIDALLERVRNQSWRPTHITLGYLVNCHRGHPVIAEGERIEGLPVELDRGNKRTIRVYARRRDGCSDYVATFL